MNKYPVSSRRGAQVFFNETDGQGKQLADCVQKSFNAMEEATREYAALKGDYYILNSHPYPACIAELSLIHISIRRKSSTRSKPPVFAIG